MNMDWIGLDWIACNRSAMKARALEQEPGDGWHVLLFCAECMRIQSFLSGEKSDRIHAMAGRSLSEPKPSNALVALLLLAWTPAG